MKHLFSLVLAGIIGGMITLGGYSLLRPGAMAIHQEATYAQPVKNINVPAQVNAVPFDFKAAAARAMPAVVHISAISKAVANSPAEKDPFRFFFGDDFNPFGNGTPPQGGTGSGVIYSSDGYIITNNHVVQNAGQVEVTLYDNRTFEAQVIGADEKSDLAVIKIEGYDFPILERGNSDEAQIGEWVLAVGNPFDLTSTVTAGIISAKGRSINLLGGGRAIESFIQTDAAVNPGNSGGALVDAEGRLLGINTAIATRTGVFSGYSFAIPVSLVTRIADDIIEYGSFQRAFLGVTISDLDYEYAQELGVNINQGVVIQELADGGSAQYAGLQPKDIIIGVNGREVKSVPELQEIIGRAKAGDLITLKINRRGNVEEIPVRLKAG
ncbi:MAG: trypsin-like peptidase domain-containing protein [Lewinellaceae bacterium]|nr:trypsin-like peptidase domain-containing protein [Phaeodactylibacter sp.]MCB0612257.1 trypsin-like peptidase domain-containing protein [Phaeodactylibacter sp.]MCB9346820.1 trypsin-like peptidase domain-containing protein [Lewinellaceae bacterium]